MAHSDLIYGPFFIGLIAIAMGGCTNLPASNDTCAIPKAQTDSMLTLSFADFDQDQSGGWRSVEKQTGCERRAAEVIVAYLRTNPRPDHEIQLTTLQWHAGQMSANAGMTRQAIAMFKASTANSGPDMKYYANATIAFLKRDRQAFDAARTSLATVPKPQGFDEAMVGYQAKYNQPPPIWPMNLDVVDRMGRCFDSPYGVAYGGTC